MSKAFFSVNADGQLVTAPHFYQTRVLCSQAQTTIAFKGWRGGATSTMPFWLEKTMKACGPGGRALHYLVLTPTITAARAGVMGQLISVFQDTLKIGIFKDGDVKRLVITPDGERYLWGHEQREPTEIHFCYGKNPRSFAHYTALAALVDEFTQDEFDPESYIVLGARLATARSQKSAVDGRAMGRIFMASTIYRLGWAEDLLNDYIRAVYNSWKLLCAALRETKDPKERDVMRRAWRLRYDLGLIHPELNIIRFDSSKNPLIDPEFIERERALRPRWFFRMRYCARFEKPAGTIYEAWEPSRHVVDPFKLPDSWPRKLAVDFGRKNFYGLFVAHDEKRDRCFIYDSYHEEGLEIPEHVENLRRIEPNLSMVVGGNWNSEQYERDQMAVAGLPCLPPAFKSLWTGINAVDAAIRTNKIFCFRTHAHGRADKELSTQLRSYSRPYDKDTGDVLADEDPIDKETFHWCFVAGTLIETPRGQVPIESLKIGDLVVTRCGAKKVVAVGARSAENIKQLTVSDGRAIVGTGDHPIWTTERGFVPLDSLRYYDTLFSIEDLEREQCQSRRQRAGSQKSLNLAGSDFIVTRTPRTNRCADIFGSVNSICTKRCGRRLMGQFQRAMRYITVMATRSTMRLQTWNVCPSLSIAVCTDRSELQTGFGSLSESDRWQPHGTRQNRAGLGIRSTQQNLFGQTENRVLTLARIVARILNRAKEAVFVFVAMLVKRHGESRTLTRTKMLTCVPGAARTFFAQNIWRLRNFALNPAPSVQDMRKIGMQGSLGAIIPAFVFGAKTSFLHQRPVPNAAPIRVRDICDGQRSVVYNLTVEDAHEYFVNGILVSNCDALRYLSSRVHNNLLSPQSTYMPHSAEAKGARRLPEQTASALYDGTLMAGGGMQSEEASRFYERHGLLGGGPFLPLLGIGE